MHISHVHILLVQLVAAALGTALTVIAADAYRQQRECHLRNAAIGFGVMTLAVFVETIAHHYAAIDVHDAQLVDGALLAVAFAIFLYGLIR